jgi:hypothetical protein
MTILPLHNNPLAIESLRQFTSIRYLYEPFHCHGLYMHVLTGETAENHCPGSATSEEDLGVLIRTKET